MKKTSEITSVIQFLSVLAILLMSKTYFFGVANRSVFQYVFYIIGLVAFLLIKKNAKKCKIVLFQLIPLIFLLLINLICYYREMNNNSLNSVLGLVFTFAITGLISVCMDAELFSLIYIRLMAIMCLISLPCNFLANFFPNVVKTFFIPNYNWETPVGYSFFYTWGWNGVIFQRNSGMFWEPGAFQAFIIIAFIFLLYNTDNNRIKNRKFIAILFIITILTTQSTTGYLLLLMLVICKWNLLQTIFTSKSKYLQLFIVFLLSFFVILVIISSGNIEAKLTNEKSDSAFVRQSDLIGGISLIIRGGIIGLGETTNRSYLRELFNVYEYDSVGLFAMTYTYGILFGIIYVIILISGIKSFFNVKRTSDIVFLIFLFLILHCTEGLWFLPVFIIIPLLGNSSNNSIINLRS